MTIEIRACRGGERRDFLAALWTSFGDSLAEGDEERFVDILDMDRTLAAFDGETIVGTAAAFGFDMSVPGGELLPTAGVTMIGVLPTHRRRGLMSRLMGGLIDDARARREPAALLWASEESIYQRFGFGLASNQGGINIERSKAAFLDDSAPGGEIRLIDLDEADTLLPPVYDALRSQRPGMLSRTPAWWRRHTLADPQRSRSGSSEKFCCVFSDGGEVRGYALYRISDAAWTDEGIRSGTVRVQELAGLDAVAQRELWRYLFGIDLVDRIKASFLPADLPLTLMLQEPRRLRFAKSESLWLRLLDVPAALQARSYDVDGEVSFAITDDLCPWNDGEWTLQARDGERKVARGGDAQIALDVAGLAAVFLGAFTFADLARAGRLDECIDGGIDTADRLFRAKVAPWCAEVF